MVIWNNTDTKEHVSLCSIRTDSCLQWWRWNRSWPVCVWLLVIFWRMDLSDRVCMFTFVAFIHFCTLGACTLFLQVTCTLGENALKINEYINAFNSHTQKSTQMIHTSPGSLKSSKSDQSLDSIWDHIFVLFLSSLLGNSILIYLLNIKLHIHRFNTAIKRDRIAEMGSWSLLHMEEKEGKRFSWDKLATTKDRNDKHTPCIWVFM